MPVPTNHVEYFQLVASQFRRQAALDAQLGGQIRAGFAVTGFYEDSYEAGKDPLSNYIATFIAPKATKLHRVG